MKSIFLLCEYGIPVGVVRKLIEKKVGIEDIVNDKKCLNDIFIDTSPYKATILKNVENVLNMKENMSCYDLLRYDLSEGLIKKIIANRVTISDLMYEDYSGLSSMGNVTTQKILSAFKRLRQDPDNCIYLNGNIVETIIKKDYKDKFFDKNDIWNNIQSQITYEEFEDCFNSLLENELIRKIDKKELYKVNINFNNISLAKYKMPPTIVTKMKNDNVNLQELVDNFVDFTSDVSEGTRYKVQESLDRIQEDLKDERFVTDKKLLKIITGEFKYETFTKDQFFEKILDRIDYQIAFENTIEKLIDMKKIDCFGEMFRVHLDSIDEVVEKFEGREKEILFRKFNGDTLETIGKSLGLTRERIRQILVKSLRKIHRVKEDDYKEIFKKYSFSQELFCEMFELNEMSYFYLKEKYNSGENDLVELLDSEEINNSQKNVLRKYLKMIKYCDENIVVNRANIILTYMKNTERRVYIDEILSEFNRVVQEFNLEELERPLCGDNDKRTIDAMLNKSYYVLTTIGDGYRYFNCFDIEENTKNELENLLDLEDGFYSTLFFFENTPLLMKELNIKDEYELHNLLRKVVGEKDNVVFSQMPYILIGNCNNKNEFLLEKINELSPISVEEFVDYMYENYGLKKTSLYSLITAKYSNYIFADKLVSNVLEFSEVQINMLKNLLIKDIYSLDALRKILFENLKIENYRYINNFNLSKLGYKVRGHYIMKSSIGRLEAYIREQIDNNDFYYIDPDMKKIGSTFSSYLCKFIAELKLFEVSEDKYITMKKLNEIGIVEEDVKELINNIQDTVSENKYFNWFSLKENLNKSILEKFEKFKFSDCFYETIISSISNIQYFRVKNNYIFIKAKENSTREIFINSFIVKDKMYISEIKDELKTKYNIILEESYIKEFINRKKYYIHHATNCIYVSEEKFAEETEKWDILSFLN